MQYKALEPAITREVTEYATQVKIGDWWWVVLSVDPWVHPNPLTGGRGLTSCGRYYSVKKKGYDFSAAPGVTCRWCHLAFHLERSWTHCFPTSSPSVSLSLTPSSEWQTLASFTHRSMASMLFFRASHSSSRKNIPFLVGCGSPFFLVTYRRMSTPKTSACVLARYTTANVSCWTVLRCRTSGRPTAENGAFRFGWAADALVVFCSTSNVSFANAVENLADGLLAKKDVTKRPTDEAWAHIMIACRLCRIQVAAQTVTADGNNSSHCKNWQQTATFFPVRVHHRRRRW